MKHVCNNCGRTNKTSTINAQRDAGFRVEHISCQHCGQQDLVETSATIYTAHNARYLMPANTPTRKMLINGQPVGADLGTCQTSKGKVVISWGLNLPACKLEDGQKYARIADHFERIISV